MSSEPRSHAIETMFLEERRYPPPEHFAAQANAQAEIYERDLEGLWESEGRERRRLLRDVAEKRPLGDTTTLADPTVVEEIRGRAVEEAPEE
jgi:hypothetical protein